MSSRQSDLDRFYGLLVELETRSGGKRQLTHCDGRMGWPERGVYFFFENGELRSDQATHRVVRVGTHGLRPSKSTLWGRLSQHKGNVGGSMPGGGNHRGSIFRLHVGTALLGSGEWPDSIRDSWGQGSTAPRDVRQNEYPLEQAVSARIGAMPFLWLGVADPPSAKSDRARIETGTISLLSTLDPTASDRPSAGWLGHHADRESIRGSGLWNVNHVRATKDPVSLEVLEHHLAQFGGR